MKAVQAGEQEERDVHAYKGTDESTERCTSEE